MTQRQLDNVDTGSNTADNNIARINKTQKSLLISLIRRDGMAIKDAAVHVGIKYSTARSIYSKFMIAGVVEDNKRSGNNPSKLTTEVLEKIERIIQVNSRYTLLQIQQKLAEMDVILSISSIDKGLKTLMITLKRVSLLVDRVNAQESLFKRKLYAQDFAANSPLDKTKCIFIDECVLTCIYHGQWLEA